MIPSHTRRMSLIGQIANFYLSAHSDLDGNTMFSICAHIVLFISAAFWLFQARWGHLFDTKSRIIILCIEQDS